MEKIYNLESTSGAAVFNTPARSFYHAAGLNRVGMFFIASNYNIKEK